MREFMPRPVHIAAISGSLRRYSFNSGLLRAAAEELPEAVTMEILDLAPIPLFNQDLFIDRQPPEAVRFFKGRIDAANALLIATPEYNYSISGVLKNALDWASRPPQESVLGGKPLGIIGAGGIMGTSRAQYHLRQVAQGTNMLAMTRPELFVIKAAEKFDAEGHLTDELTRQRLAEYIKALADWTRRLCGG